MEVTGSDGTGNGKDENMLYLKNGYMIDPASGTEGDYDILIDTDSGKIEKIAPQGTLAEEGMLRQGAQTDSGIAEKAGKTAEVIDLNGQIIAPGLVDVHVHFRDPGFTYKEVTNPGRLRRQRAALPPWC